MITQKEIAEELNLIAKLDVFRITRRREYVEARSLLNYILYNYKRMTLSKITEFYNNNGWNINHATIIHSMRSFDLHKKCNPVLVIWLEHIVDNINKMVISNMHDREIELKNKKYITRKYEKQL